MSAKSGEKKELILRTAMQLFAVKGASATSMQEIAEVCGMSKGSLYLQFKSKEELELSLFDYCFGMLQNHLLQVEQRHELNPREKLCLQIEVMLNLVLELREFLMVQFRDRIANNNQQHPDFLKKHNAQLLRYIKEKFISLYGNDITPYIADLVLLGHGMLSTYTLLLFNPNISVGTSQMAQHLVNLLDITANNMISKHPQPLVSEEVFALWTNGQSCSIPSGRHPLQTIKELKELSVELIQDQQEQKQAIESLEILEGELLIPLPRRAIIGGMLYNLSSISLLEHHQDLLELKSLLQPYLTYL